MKNLGIVLLVSAVSLAFIFLMAVDQKREISNEPFYPVGRSYSYTDGIMFTFEITDIPGNVPWYGSFEHIWYSYNSITDTEELMLVPKPQYSFGTVHIYYHKATDQITRLSFTGTISYAISRDNDTILMDGQLVTDLDDIATCESSLNFYSGMRDAIYETHIVPIEHHFSQKTEEP